VASTPTPTPPPTPHPTPHPTLHPTPRPSSRPSSRPSPHPTPRPSPHPTPHSTLFPTLLPSSLPSLLPTDTPPPLPDSTTLTGDSRHFCSSSRPCGKCYGDCDDDSECAGELICYNRQNFDPVPGCSDFGTLGFDYCTIPPSDSNTDERPRFASGSKESLSVLAAIGVAVLAVILGGCC